MPLASSLAILFGLGLAIPIDSALKTHSINRKVAEMERRRAFWPTDYKLEREIRGKIWDDWEGEKNYFPPLLVPFFEENVCALLCYKEALKNSFMEQLGYRPLSANSSYFGSGEYNPFREYERLYGPKEREWLLKHHPEVVAELDEKKRIEEEKKAKIKAEQEKAAKKRAVKLTLITCSIIIFVCLVCMAISNSIIGGALAIGILYILYKIFFG